MLAAGIGCGAQAQVFPATISLSALNGANGFRVIGAAAYDLSGRALSGAGDINGDGIDDLLIGSTYADPNGNDASGSSYVVFGNGTGFAATLDLGSLDGANGFRLDGVMPGDRSGRAVSAAGDVNGDGIDDLLIGANGTDPSGSDSGSSYVVFGTRKGFAATFDLASLDGTNGFRLDGSAPYDGFGRAVTAAGDINGDGLDDLLIGAPAARPNGNIGAGSSYVIFGRSKFAATLPLGNLDGTTGFRIDGASESDYAGAAVSAVGDVNGDGIDDLLIGAYLASPNGAFSGSSFVVFGQSSFGPTLNLGSLDGGNGFRINGVSANDRSGRAVSGAGDVNGDGIDDLLVGAPNAAPNGNYSGSSYLIFGARAGFPAIVNLDAFDGTNGFRLDGATPGDSAGVSVSGVGDVNGDGIDDLIVGANYADTNGIGSGSSYVVFGRRTGFAATLNLGSLDGANGFRLDGAAGETSGRALSAAGDVNNDGVVDLLIGAPFANSNGRDSGSSYVLFGGVDGPGLVPAVALTPNLIDFGDVPVDQSGVQSVSIANTGTSSLELGTVEVSGAAVGDFVLSNDSCSGQMLPPAADCSIIVTMTPSSSGLRDAQVTIPSNAPSSPDALGLVGVGLAPAIDITPASVDFLEVQVGQTSAAQRVRIDNVGNDGLDLGVLGFSGAHSEDFVLTSDECSAQLIAPGSSCSFDVALAPSAIGARNAQLSVPSNAASNPDAVPLAGVGTEPTLGELVSVPAHGRLGLLIAGLLLAVSGSWLLRWQGRADIAPPR